MPNTSDPGSHVSADEFRLLLKLAGLNVSEARAPRVLDELNAQVRMIRTIDPVIHAVETPATTPYDPAFPKVNLEDEAE
jgi:hypothetical protein